MLNSLAGWHTKKEIGATPRSFRQLASMLLDEFRRGMTAARRYEELQRNAPCSRRPHIPRILFEELYAGDSES